MTFPIDRFPRLYRINKNGHRVLAGLSIEETFEFETLDNLAPLLDIGGHIPWADTAPITGRERRWRELYLKHEEAWKVTVAKRRASLW